MWALREKKIEPIFSETALNWTTASKRAGKNKFCFLQPRIGTNQLTELQRILSSQSPADEELWIVLVGHGTFDGREAKFNLEGPDLSATESRQVDHIDTKAGGLHQYFIQQRAFPDEISGTNRIVNHRD